MTKLGFIVGTEVSYAYPKFIRENQSWLTNLPKEWKEWGYSFDLTVLCSAIHNSKNTGIEVIAIDGNNLTQENVDACDYVFPLYEIGYTYYYQGIPGVKKYENIMRKTSAILLPSLSFQQFIVHKLDYMNLMKKNGIDIIPTIGLNMNSYKRNKTKFIDNLLKNKQSKKWGKCIMKPELAGFKSGFKFWKNWNNATKSQLRAHFDKMVKLGYPNVLFQPFVAEFMKFYEVSTYWLNGEFIYSYGSRFESAESLNYEMAKPEVDGGKMKDSLVDMVKEKAKKVIEVLKKEFTNLPIQMRLDFGCCVDNDNYIRNYFLNEIEFVPTINEYETVKPNYFLLGKAVVDRVKTKPTSVAERRRNINRKKPVRKTQKKSRSSGNKKSRRTQKKSRYSRRKTSKK